MNSPEGISNSVVLALVLILELFASGSLSAGATSTDALLKKAEKLEWQFRCWDAIPYLDTAIRQDPKSATAYRKRGLNYHNISATADVSLELYRALEHQALADLTKAIELDPNSKQNYIDRAIVSLGDDNGTAMSDLNKAISMDPTSVEAFWHRGIAYYMSKQYESGIDDYTKAISLSTPLGTKRSDNRTRLFHLYVGRGKSYNGMKKYENAVEDFSTAINMLNKTNAPLYFSGLLGEAHFFRAKANEELGNDILAAEDRQTSKALGYGGTTVKSCP